MVASSKIASGVEVRQAADDFIAAVYVSKRR